MTRYRNPAVRARESEKRRLRYATDPEYRERLRTQNLAGQAPGQHRAHEAVARAIKRGEMTRPGSCENCGQGETLIEAAHFDYSRPLDVRWLCRSCHRRWDSNEPKTKPEDRHRRQRLHDPESHDYRGYARGCRCDICRIDAVRAVREYRHRRKARIQSEES